MYLIYFPANKKKSCKDFLDKRYTRGYEFQTKILHVNKQHKTVLFSSL